VASIKTRVDFKGPFFERDPRKTCRANVMDMMDALAAEGKDAVQQEIAANAGRMPRYTGHTRDATRGRTKSLKGKRWQLHAVVSTDTSGMDRAAAIRTKAAAASIERRFHPFRRVAGRMRRARAVISANLTKGL